MRPRLITPADPHPVHLPLADDQTTAATSAAAIERIVQEALDDLRTERVRRVDLDDASLAD